jgi:hypothetical protein
LTIADIFLEETTNEEIMDYADSFINDYQDNMVEVAIIDPSLHYKECSKHGELHTMVSYEEIAILA